VTSDPGLLDATGQAELVRAGELTPRELVAGAIERIARVDPEVHAVIHERFERALAEADAAPDGAFRGVPVLVKDHDGGVAGEPYHHGNAALRDAGIRADRDAHLVARLRAAGCVVVGKTNTPEFGLLPTTEPLAYGATRNPWDPGRSPGGSSGGSAAAVAAGMVPLAHAGDGGGSIRIPASACGVFGLKPTRGRVSLGPDESQAWGGLVQRHVVTRTVRDCATALDALAGAMPGDPYAAAPPTERYGSQPDRDPGRLRVGLRTEAPGGLADVEPACAAAARDAAALLEACGHEVVESAPEALDDPSLLGSFVTIFAASTSADVRMLATTLGRPVGPADVEPLTWAQHELGAAITAPEYIAALHDAGTWSRAMAAWWEPDGGGFDLLLTPTMAKLPAILGTIRGDDPEGALIESTPYAAFTVPFNITGQPAMSVPLSWHDGLPVGVQLAAAFGREDLLLRVAGQLERARPWATRRPPLHT